MKINNVPKYFVVSLQLGALAVAIRQTNVIWMFFVASSEVVNIAFDRQKDKIDTDDSGTSIREHGQQASENSSILGSNLRKRKIGGRVVAKEHSTPSVNASSKSSMPGLIMFWILELFYQFAEQTNFQFFIGMEN